MQPLDSVIAGSLWLSDAPAADHRSLEGDLSVDVAVIGAGIAGLTTAALLEAGGASVAVLEAGRVGHGVSGHTTAKVTALHGLRYATLERSWGELAARTYAESNAAGVELLAELAGERGIECGLERAPAYVYAETGDGVRAVEREADAARRAGLEATLTADAVLPFPVRTALRLSGQIQIDPYRYLVGLARSLRGPVFEGTRALAIEEREPCRVRTARGSVVAGDVILATLIPFLDRGAFFARTHPERSYLLAVRPGRDAGIEGMYLSAETPTRSLRSALHGGERLVLVGGEGHKSGQERRAAERPRRLERFARERLGPVEVRHRWSSQDFLSADGVPFVGRMTPLSSRLYVATGFGKWGMSAGTVAGRVLADAILKRRNVWSWLYDPNRVNAGAAARSLVAENLNVARRFVSDRLVPPAVSPAADLRRGDGRVVRRGGRLLAVSRDADGRARAVSAVCPHLGCVVAWNGAEQSWDCPCHGSRFGTDGGLLQGPAVDGLAPEEA